MKRNAQIFTLDFLLGFLAFIVVILIVVNVLQGMFISQEFSTVYADATHISDVLMTSGYPLSWSSADIILLGIVDDSRINTTKLMYFDSFNYTKQKSLVQSTADFIFTFENATETLNVSTCTHGYPITTDEFCEINFSSIEYTDLTKVERIVIYNSTPVRMVVYTWN